MASFVSSDVIFPKETFCSVDVNGIETEIICSTFSDYYFVVATQINKFGTILRAEAAEKSDGGYIFTINTLLGRRDDPLLSIFARQIIERISSHSSKPLILSISLREEGRSKENFEAIVNKILESLIISP